MKPLALSTMFAQQDRFEDGAEFARFAAAAGYDAIEISHSTDERKLRGVIESRVLPVVSVHQPAPWVRHSDGRGNSKCNLASTDRIERVCAIDYARETLNWAAKLGASRIVVHLGAVTEESMFQEEYDMRRLFDSGRAGEPRFAELREATIARRREHAEPYVEAARRSLRELVQYAEPLGVAIGIENRYHYHEIPLPEEYGIVLDGLDPAQAGYWHDTGHAEVLHRLGLVDRHAWFAANQGRVIGAHLHDVLGIGDHRSPGDGDVDWGYITEGLRHLPAYTLEINQHQPDELVAAAPAFLAKVGLR
ncbi:MAG: sugar phosphate isomerase/epimerase [Dehalococcoidia bacterium]|nr:sugar phosphate isomerase/epimerase [Dehalococcoidia bacterium]